MVIRFIGAAMILAAGGGFGFAVARNYRKEEAALEELIRVIDFLSAELSCNLTPLPELCSSAAKQSAGIISQIFEMLGNELLEQFAPDAQSCMESALKSVKSIPSLANQCLVHIGRNLGRFDLEGQLNGLESAKQMCIRNLAGLQNNRDNRLRSYQTLGFCAGAALVILLI